MSVVITAKRFYSEFARPTSFGDAGNTTIDASVGDKVKAVIDFYIKWSTESKLLVFNATAKTITRTDDFDSGSFIDDGFKVGDSFTIAGTSSNDSTGKIISEVTDRVITTSTTLVNETAELASLYGTTSVTSIDFYYNLIKNSDSESYFSLVDRDTQQKFYADSILASTTGTSTYLRIGTNSYGWVTEPVTDDLCTLSSIVGMGISNYKQQFRLTQYFISTPFWLNGQEDNLEESPNFPPPEYESEECLKYICKVDAKFDKYNAVVPHTGSDASTNGITSWFDETLNGRSPEYSITSIVYTDYATGLALDKPDINKVTDVVITLASKNARFVNAAGATNGTYFTVNIARCAKDETEYINTLTTLRENFMYDRVLMCITTYLNWVGGENYGTDYRVLKHISANFVSTSVVQIGFKIDYADYLKELLKDKPEEDRQLMIWITTEKQTEVIS